MPTPRELEAEYVEPPKVYFGSPNWLEEGSLCMLWGAAGISKTWVAMGLALCLASGTPCLGFTAPAGPKKVLYLDGEMPKFQVKERITKLLRGGMIPPSRLPLALDNAEWKRWVDMPDEGLNLLRGEGRQYPGQQWVNQAILAEGADIIFVDNLSILAPADEDNDQASWSPMIVWLNLLRNSGKTVILVHHAGKNAYAQRGTSRKEDGMDTIISLTHPPKRKRGEAQEGPSTDPEAIIWTWKKHRRFIPTKPFEVCITDTSTGVMITTADKREIEEALKRQRFEAVERDIRAGIFKSERETFMAHNIAGSSYRKWRDGQ